MPSSYTANGGIELPANGEQSATWGDTVNDNMNILDRITNGIGVISLSGTTHTLTTSNGALSDGQYKVLVLAGSPTGTNTITVTPNDGQHVYFVKNASGQTATFSQGTGSNVSVANGKTAIIYCDGSGSGANVVDLTGTLAMTAAAITSGTINGTSIGATSASTGAFTSLSASTGDFVTLSVGSAAITATPAELNTLDGITATTAELNTLDGFTGAVADLNYAKDLRATGVTTTEFDYLDGVTSAIQTQIDTKAPLAGPTFTGAVNAGDKVVLGSWEIVDTSNILYFKYGGATKFKLDTGGNLTVYGDVTAKDTSI